MIDDLHSALASAHAADLHRDADRARLAQLATCGHATGLSGLISRLRGGGAQDCSV